MDFRQLETFIAVVKLKSFSKAAEKLFITQPTVTNHIQNLEKELGTLLINRMGKKISLTQAGAILYTNSLNIINSFEMTKFELEAFKGHIQGNLNIVASSVPRKYYLPKLIKAFYCLYPEVTFTVIDNDSKEVVTGIIDGEYEFGIVGAKYESYNVEYISILMDNLVLIAPNDFMPHIDNFGDLDIKDILTSSFIFREEGSGTRKVLINQLEKKEISIDTLRTVAYIEDTESIKELVSLGVGLSFISIKAVKDDIKLGKYKALNVTGLDLRREFYLVYHKSRQLSPLGETFKDFILQKKDQ